MNRNTDLNSLINSGALNISFIEDMYETYSKDPLTVDPSWRTFFTELDKNKETSFSPSSYVPRLPEVNSSFLAGNPLLQPEKMAERSVVYYPRVEISSENDWRVYNLIQSYRTYGHLMAKINSISTEPFKEPIQLNLKVLGFEKQDLPNYFPTFGLLDAPTAPLLEIVNSLKSIYCDSIGVEYMGLDNPEMEEWIQDHIERGYRQFELSIDQKRMILQHLNKSEIFESFLHTKYVGQKRFSLEGGETLIPILAEIVDKGAVLGVEEFVIGMAHRGRLNVLSNILDKSHSDIFSEFEEGYVPASVEGSGDVKYHKGFYSEVKSVHGHVVKIVLTPNPSHLEAVDAVVEGQVRSKQVIRGDDVRQEKVAPILVHGDAALSGQGVVYETMQLSHLDGYSTGGTIHIVVNNQIGFTTHPKDGRSTHYCTDIARAFGAPVFHVNGEDPESCIFAANLAVELRQKFHCDVFIDLNCYRKYGHNETDEPAYTQPLEYQLIRKKQPIRELYRDDLIQQGLMEKNVAETLEADFKAALQQSLKEIKEGSSDTPKRNLNEAHPVVSTEDKNAFQRVSTGVPQARLKEIGARLCAIPQGLTIHPKLAILLKERLTMLNDDEGARQLDWGMAELLAYGSLLWDGTHVRLSGQDCCRGTFSHRHAVLMDQVKEQGYVPLQHLKSKQGRFDVYNSPLSEYAVLGFEFGYSIANPAALVLWEAQFGDFSNGAQVVIDQFIATAEQKWMQKFCLTLLLPHGYEGQGPEHSSARMERFLALCGNDNMRVANPTNPAQLFHLLRRQVLLPMHKPLVIFTPKGLLRHPACVSRLEDLAQGGFQEILDDPLPPRKAAKLVLCSGRIYYDLIAERQKVVADNVGIVRIEQLYPLDLSHLKDIIEKYSGFKECFWVQEEPSNMGAWDYMRPILREVLPKGVETKYIGRARSASPAAGSHAVHKTEHAAIMKGVFGKGEPSIFEIAGNFKA
jgi:2-oxoglutarate dehydrogenase E1 component